MSMSDMLLVLCSCMLVAIANQVGAIRKIMDPHSPSKTEKKNARIVVIVSLVIMIMGGLLIWSKYS